VGPVGDSLGVGAAAWDGGGSTRTLAKVVAVVARGRRVAAAA
jgi:hypothetical protein